MSCGDVGRNTVRGPGINNFDLALFKNFELGQAMRLQFRLESFNAFNHTQFEPGGVERNSLIRADRGVGSIRPRVRVASTSWA